MTQNEATVRRLIDAINGRDGDAMDGVFTDDVVMEWPQSNERIVGNRNRREVYARFPALPTVSNPRIDEEGDLVVLEADLDYGDGDPYQCVFVFRMRDGLIAGETAYWSKPFPAAEWRAEWVEPIRT